MGRRRARLARYPLGPLAWYVRVSYLVLRKMRLGPALTLYLSRLLLTSINNNSYRSRHGKRRELLGRLRLRHLFPSPSSRSILIPRMDRPDGLLGSLTRLCHHGC